jgi:DNA-binding MarR family transcriptional regulator
VQNPEMLKTFRAFKVSGDFRRRHLPFLKTLEDQDLIREIGFSEAAGHPLSLKQLFTHGISSVATVQRRLARLRRLGIVEQTRSEYDKRVLKLTLTPAARKLYVRWARQLRNSWK